MTKFKKYVIINIEIKKGSNKMKEFNFSKDVERMFCTWIGTDVLDSIKTFLTETENDINEDNVDFLINYMIKNSDKIFYD